MYIKQCIQYTCSHNTEGCKQQIKKLEQEVAQKDQVNQELETNIQYLNSLQDEFIEYQKQAQGLKTEVSS